MGFSNPCHAPVHSWHNLELFSAPSTYCAITNDTVEAEEIIEEPVRYIANVSWYTAADDECGKSDGITASGEMAVAGVTVAADDLPLGTIVRINGHDYIVQDRFGGSYRNRIDIYCDSKEEAFKNGRQYLEVEIVKEV